jgi:hypothetical protein
MNNMKGKKGIFKPKKLNTLRPELEPAIGKTFLFYYMWTAEEGETYASQAVYRTVDEEGYLTHLDELDGHWVPEEDIEWVD